MADEPNFAVLAETECIGVEFYKTYSARTRRKTERASHEIVWKLIRFTNIDDRLPELDGKYARHLAVQFKGLLLERVDDNSKAQPKGTIIWKHRDWLDLKGRHSYDSYRAKGFKARYPQTRSIEEIVNG